MERNFLERLTHPSSYRFYVMLLIIVFAFLVRYLLVNARPFQSDESLYTYAAYAIVRGVIPYREIMLAHPPIMYLIFGLFLQFTGTNLQLFRILNYGIFIVNILLTYVLCQEVIGSKEGVKIGLLGAALYAFYPTIVGFSLTASVEFILTFFTLCSVIVCAKYAASSRKLLFLSGIFLGFALMTKFTALFFIVTLALFYTIGSVLDKKFRVNAIGAALLFAGVSIPVVSVLLVIIQQWDAWHIFQLNTYYVQTIRSPFTLSEKLNVLSFYLGTFSFLLVTGALGAIHLAMDAIKQKKWWSIMPVWVYGANAIVLAFLPICLPHYFLYLTPYLVLLSARNLGDISGFQVRKLRIRMLERLGQKRAALVAFALILGLASLLASPYAPGQAEYFHESSYTEVEKQIGKHIASETEFNELVWTSEPAIAFFAERLIVAPRSNEWAFQGFFNDVFNTTYDGGHQGLGVVSPTEFVEAWEEEKINLIIFIRGKGWVPYPDEILWKGFENQEGVASYIEEHYELIESVNQTGVPYVYEIWRRK